MTVFVGCLILMCVVLAIGVIVLFNKLNAQQDYYQEQLGGFIRREAKLKDKLNSTRMDDDLATDILGTVLGAFYKPNELYEDDIRGDKALLTKDNELLKLTYWNNTGRMIFSVSQAGYYSVAEALIDWFSKPEWNK